MNPIIADKAWYREISAKKGKFTHCPFATVVLCIRYYQSLSLIGDAGATKIDDEEDDRL